MPGLHTRPLPTFVLDSAGLVPAVKTGARREVGKHPCLRNLLTHRAGPRVGPSLRALSPPCWWAAISDGAAGLRWAGHRTHSKVVPAGVPLGPHCPQDYVCPVTLRCRCEKTASEGATCFVHRGTYKASRSVDGERAQQCATAAGCVRLGQVPARRRPWAFPEQRSDGWWPKAWGDCVSGYSIQREDIVSALFP